MIGLDVWTDHFSYYLYFNILTSFKNDSNKEDVIYCLCIDLLQELKELKLYANAITEISGLDWWAVH